ncbi:MAG: UvrABC system protein C [candidate division WS6 bacterium OLB20]|uniref:UvrABC system protein C n=1 Tax=candidate division WS6 bacterium OLB20 TaxID=1617426 RepID=A0A136M0R6_9BACT|nr:MAG: UvrABC system protein C [candidate division WS6 bacterium OLB20]
MYPSESVKQTAAQAPLQPGCYIYRNSDGHVLYVGKAKVLRNRVRSYFEQYDQTEPKIRKMVPQIDSIEFVVTDSELEALLLETNLIKKYRPKYNTRMKDDKNYVWLRIDSSADFPRISVVREKKGPAAEYLGPYPSTLPVKRILRMLRKIYPYRTCTRIIEEVRTADKNGTVSVSVKSSDPKPCLYYYLGLCQAPCAGAVSSTDYKKNTASIRRFFTNDKHKLQDELRKAMQQAAADRQFERAAQLRDKAADLEAITQRISIRERTDEKLFAEEKQKRQETALLQLTAKLDMYDLEIKKGFRIECFDISNIQGKHAVGSMVVFKDGKPAKSLYRKFKIKTKDTPDDFAMMREVLTRRLKRSESSDDESFRELPDLLIVDGGKGQLSSAYQILTEQGFALPVIGLAKRMEEIFIPREEDGELGFLKRTLRAGSEGRFLIQRIRDESHRFAISYHRNLRSKSQLKSGLDDIPGIGPVTKRRLLQAFGSMDGIKKANADELNQIIKNRTTVERIIKLRDLV